MIPVEWIPELLLADMLAVTAWLVLAAARRAWEVDGSPAEPPAVELLPWRDRSAEWAFLRRPTVATRPPSDEWVADLCRGAGGPYLIAGRCLPPAPARLELHLTARCRWPSPVPVTQELEVVGA